MTPTLLAASLAAFLTLLPGLALAADAGQQSWTQVFDQLDQDRDGALSRTEFERANSLLISATPVQNPYLPAASLTGTSPQPGQIPYLVLVPNPAGSGQHQGTSVPNQSTSSPWQNSLVAFESLDVDRNGYLNAVEALRSYPLIQSWNRVDVNRDGQIERAEFSAFELGAMR